jgi:hypothetical protein
MMMSVIQAEITECRSTVSAGIRSRIPLDTSRNCLFYSILTATQKRVLNIETKKKIARNSNVLCY